MVAAAVGSGPRYAPVDPTLPPPWRALVDGNTGYIYYWNTETNVTQYEKPLPAQPPPLPAGPPPVISGSAGPKVAVVASATSSGTADVQNARSSEGRGSANGNVPASAVVSSHGSGGNVHGMTGGTAHAGGGGSNFSNSSGSGPVNSGGGSVPGNMYGNSSNNAPGHPGGHMPGSGPRSGSSMSGGTMHMNATDNSFGSSGRHAHGSSGGTMRVVSGGNVHASAARNAHSGNVPAQPKLAALPVPQRQQGMGGMHIPLQPRQIGHANSSGPGPSAPPGMSPAAAYKRAASDHINSDPDLHKRPRMQGFSDPPLALDLDAYRRQHEISVMGDNVPPPFMTFEAANFPPEIARELHTAGFSAPTPIQAQSWPLALQSRDIVAIAKTGSGKTLGYLLPAFLHLARNRTNSQLGPVVLVLAPTRELATQIQDEAVKFGRSSRLSCTCVYGGAPKGQQLRELDKGADIVIATPGRLNDFLEMKKVSLRQVSYLVLDEADRMLDMGFEPQIRKIVNEIPPRRQTLMYTATWPKEVRKIAGDLLVNAVQVNIGNSDELSANKAITQHVEIVPPYEKQRRLEQILRSQEPGSKIIIFCSTKKMCDQLARSLGRAFGAAAIHGDKSQTERDYVLAQFKAGRSPILVATDVAARGLDIKDIRVVINFDFPTGVEDYVHRIGRTGRAGATGVAFTFFSEQDSKYAKELIRVLEGASQKVPLELRDLAGKSFHPKGRAGRWEGMGGRDGGYNNYGGGRGDGRGDAFGGRGSWGPPSGQFDRRDRNFERFGDRERFPDRNVVRDKFSDDRNRGREVVRKFGVKERGCSYSRSYSRSPSRSRGRSYSRSRSPDRYSDDHYRRSPYRGRGPYRRSPHRSRSPYKSKSPYRSVSPRSPYKSRSPYRHGRIPIASNDSQPLDQPSFPGTESKFSADSKDRHSPPPDQAIAATVDSKVSIAKNDSHLPEQATVTGIPRETEEVIQPAQQEKIAVEHIDDTGGESSLVGNDGVL